LEVEHVRRSLLSLVATMVSGTLFWQTAGAGAGPSSREIFERRIRPVDGVTRSDENRTGQL
jgi:hypothetical protein